MYPRALGPEYKEVQHLKIYSFQLAQEKKNAQNIYAIYIRDARLTRPESDGPTGPAGVGVFVPL